jgi:importin-5
MMSILPPEIHNALTQLLQGLSSADNEARSFAEDQLNTAWVAARPDVLLMGLVELLSVAQEPSVSGCASLSLSCCQGRSVVLTCPRILQSRSFAAVLFRRIATKTRKLPGSDESKELFLALQQPQKIAIRQKLLECLQTEELPRVRHKIGDAVAEIARQYSDEGMSRPETACSGI